jgi:hypothetical protein
MEHHASRDLPCQPRTGQPSSARGLEPSAAKRSRRPAAASNKRRAGLLTNGVRASLPTETLVIPLPTGDTDFYDHGLSAI